MVPDVSGRATRQSPMRHSQTGGHVAGRDTGTTVRRVRATRRQLLRTVRRMSEPMLVVAKGQRYYAPTMAVTITVRRVARDLTWADIHVEAEHSGITWTKRQPLAHGRFPFEVEAL